MSCLGETPTPNRTRRPWVQGAALLCVLVAADACRPFVILLPSAESGTDLAAGGGMTDGGMPDALAMPFPGDLAASVDGPAPDLGGAPLSDLSGPAMPDLTTPGDGGDGGLAPFVFALTVCFGRVVGDGYVGCPNDQILLDRDGTWTSMGSTGTWKVGNNGTEFYMDTDGSTWAYVGAVTMPGCFEGTFGNSLPIGPSGIWQGCFQ